MMSRKLNRIYMLAFVFFSLFTLMACEDAFSNASSTLSFELNNGTLETSQEKVEAQPGESVELPTPSKEGHTFEGWYHDEAYSDPFESGVMPEEDTTLHAKWEAYPTLTFNTQGGSEVTGITHAPDEAVELPTPTKEGHTFEGWYQDDTYSDPFDSETMPEEDTTLHAKWEAYPTLTFNTQGGSEVTGITHAPDEAVELPTPTKEGHTFEGWYQDDTYSNPFDSETMPEEDTTLHAKWEAYPTLSFNTHGGSAVDELIKAPGIPVEVPAPTKEGYTFAGWYQDEDYTSPFESGTMPEEDTVLHAKWDPYPTISFNSNGGSEVSDITQAPGTSIDLATPTKEGHPFEGWYVGESFDRPFESDVMPEEDTVLYAKWAPYPTLSFNTHGGSEVSDIEQTYNTPIDLPTPTKEGYTFEGWYRGIIYLESFDDKTMPGENMVLHARWREVPTLDQATQLQYIINTHTFDSGMTYDTVELTGYLGTEETLTIPQWISGLPVTAINFDFGENSDVRHLEIHRSVHRITRLRDFSNLTSISFYGELHFPGYEQTVTYSSDDEFDALNTQCDLDSITTSELPKKLTEGDCPVIEVVEIEQITIPDDDFITMYRIIVDNDAYYSTDNPPFRYLRTSWFSFVGLENMEYFQFPRHFELGFEPIPGLIQGLKSMESLKAFTIGDEVVNHEVIDGVLYEITDEGLELILYPMGKTDVTYHVPSGVSEFRGRVFQRLNVDAPNFVYKNPYLEAFTIDPDHETFKVENGILYSKDGSELVLVPPQKDLVEYRVDASVDKIHDYAFFSNDSLKRIVFEHGAEDGLMPYNSTLFNKHSDVTLYVHDDLVDDYKNDLMWKSYKDFIEPLSNLE